ISHVTGIPHSPTGQAIVERAHRTLKEMLQKQKGGMALGTPSERLAKALYVLNFLNRWTEGEPAMLKHFNSLSEGLRPVPQQEKAQVLVKNLAINQWEGPYP
ncbi:IGEB protein, partial [Casuarius casuarius]|nr:IGEB protein [Casuarius casuarius]